MVESKIIEFVCPTNFLEAYYKFMYPYKDTKCETEIYIFSFMEISV